MLTFPEVYKGYYDISLDQKECIGCVTKDKMNIWRVHLFSYRVDLLELKMIVSFVEGLR